MYSKATQVTVVFLVFSRYLSRCWKRWSFLCQLRTRGERDTYVGNLTSRDGLRSAIASWTPVLMDEFTAYWANDHPSRCTKKPALLHRHLVFDMSAKASRSICSAMHEGEIATEFGNILTGCRHAPLYAKRYCKHHAHFEGVDRSEEVEGMNLRQRRLSRRCEADAEDLITTVLERKENGEDIWYRVRKKVRATRLPTHSHSPL